MIAALDYLKRRKTYIVAIDAMHLKGGKSVTSKQYHVESLEREINKAFCGFNVLSQTSCIATGSWGIKWFSVDSTNINQEVELSGEMFI